MALKPQQPVLIGLDGGIDTRTDPRQVKLGQLTTAQDVSLYTPGEVQKREASAAATTPAVGGVSATAGFNIGTFQRPGAASAELITHQQLANTVADPAGFPHQPRIYGASGGMEYSPCSPYQARTFPLPQSTTSQLAPATALDTASGKLLTAYRLNGTNGIYATISRLADGAQAAAPITVNGGAYTTHAVCAVPGAGWVIAGQVGSGINLYSVSPTGSVAFLSSIASVGSTAVDICYCSGTNCVYVAYSSTTYQMQVQRTSLAGSALITLTLDSNAASEDYVFSCHANDTYVMVAYAQRMSAANFSIRAKFINTINGVSTNPVSTNNNTGPYQVSAALLGNGASPNFAIFSTWTALVTATASNPANNLSGLNAATGSLTGINNYTSTNPLSDVRHFLTPDTYDTTRQDMAILTRPFLLNGVACVAVAGSPFSNSAIYIFDYSGNIVNRFADAAISVAYSKPPAPGQFTPAPCDTYQGAIYFSFAKRLTVTTDSSWLTTLARPAALPAMQQLGTQVHVPGGVGLVYDGAYCSEEGFHHKAGTINLVNSTAPAGGGYLPSGSYLYTQTYEWVDGSGIVQQSEPALLLTFTSTGTNPTLFFPYYNSLMSYKGDALNPVSTVIWRSKLNGTVLYRVGTVTPPVAAPTAAGTGYTFQDSNTNSDTVIGANAPLYTNDGSYGRQPPGAFTHTTQYRGRLFGILAEDPTKVMYSSVWAAGLPLTWNRSYYIQVAPETGGATALTILDDALVIFTRDRVFLTGGPGPTAIQAPGTGFNALSALATSVGCSSPSSVLSISHGVVFQSREGIMLLDRSQSTQYIGGPVEALTRLYSYGRPYLYPERHMIVWEALGAADGSATTLALDYGNVTTSQLGAIRPSFRWSVWTSPTGVALASTAPGVIWTQKAGGALQQVMVPSTYLDSGNTAYPMIVETPWIPIGGSLTGYGEAWEMQVLGEFKSNHTLQVEVGYDYNGTYLSPPLTMVTSAALVSPDNVYQFRFALPQPQCIALRFRIQDTTQAGTGESCRISGLMLYMAVDDGLSRVASGKSG